METQENEDDGVSQAAEASAALVNELFAILPPGTSAAWLAAQSGVRQELISRTRNRRNGMTLGKLLSLGAPVGLRLAWVPIEDSKGVDPRP